MKINNYKTKLVTLDEEKPCFIDFIIDGRSLYELVKKHGFISCIRACIQT